MVVDCNLLVNIFRWVGGVRSSCAVECAINIVKKAVLLIDEISSIRPPDAPRLTNVVTSYVCVCHMAMT
jgi:hypothetical protein